MIRAQSGEFLEVLPLENKAALTSSKSGWIASIDGQSVGHAVITLGGGRRMLEDILNHRVGLEMLVRVGDQVEFDQPLVNILLR